MAEVPVLGVRAEFDDSEASRRMEAHTARLKAIEAALQRLADATQRSSKRAEKAQETSAQNQIKVLRTLRWNLVTFMFFLRLLGQVVEATWKRMGEVADNQALIEGVQALANAYGQSLAQIDKDMQEFEAGVSGTFDRIKAAQAGLLADQGEFADRYGELWQAARVIAVTAGGDAEDAFASLLEALATGGEEVDDTIERLFNLEGALIREAVQSGRTVDMLEDQEKKRILLNTILERTGVLLDAGARQALEATAPIDSLTKSLDGLTAVLVPGGDSLQSFADILENFTKVLIFAQAAAATFGEIIKQSILNPLQPLGDTLDQAAQVGIDKFKELAERIGVIFEDDPVGQAIRETAGTSFVDEAALNDALERYHEFLEKIFDLRDRFMRRLEDLERQHTQRLEDLERSRLQKIEDLNFEFARRRENLGIRLRRSLEDAWRKYLRTIENIEDDAADRRLKIWQKYWNSVWKINRRFQDDIWDAIADRDATAALRAIRQRERDLEDAGRLRDQELSNLQSNLQNQIEEARRRLEEMREDARRSYREGLEDLERWLTRQQEEIERDFQRQREKLEAHLAWRIETLRAQYRLEFLTALAAYTGQQELLAAHVRAMNDLWSQFRMGLNLPPIPPPPGTGTDTSDTGQIPSFAEGGMDVFNRPTRIMVGDGGVPELVIAIPLGGQQTAVPVPAGGGGQVNHNISGVVEQRVGAMVRSSLGGLEGKMTAIMANMLEQVLPSRVDFRGRVR
jgi:hypothetical protein